MVATPFFPFFRDTARFFGYKPFPPRQEFHIGYLAEHHDKNSFFKFLSEKGFTINRIAWVDDDEILSVRFLESFEYQYHLRLFKDNEVRGHHELTPEFSPLGHLKGLGAVARTEKFLEFIGECLKGHCPPKMER